MRFLGVFVYSALFAAVVLTTCPVDGQGEAKFSRRMAAGNRERRGSFYEAAFSNDEENVLKAKQGETLESISRLLGGRSVQEVERRCVELGLRCGAGAKAPPKKSEKWRAIKDDRARGQ